MFIDELNNAIGVEAISVVSEPAIESDFITLNKDSYIELAEVNKEKRLLIGAALIPNKPILRIDKETGEDFHIFFSEETVRKASQLYAKNKFQDKATLEHEKPVEGMTVVESWIVEDKDKDKSALYGLNVPVGSWCIAMKAENDEVYNLAKEGKIKGFSIEAFFTKSKEDEDLKLIKELENELLYG